MDTIEIKDCADRLERLGRTYDGPNREIYMNWSCCGLRFRFKGSCLVAKLSAMPGEEPETDLFGTTTFRKTWPYAAVFIDDAQEPASYIEISDSAENYLLFSSGSEEDHVITLRKMTENAKGKLSICAFLTDGTIEKIEEESKKLNIEFIGDSITCGFGNATNERDRMFFSADENGWMSHAAIAARKLNADFSLISYSGIAITEGLGTVEWRFPSMAQLYPYADRLIEEQLEKKDTFTTWNFEAHRPDVIVLNLGTNDANVIDINDDIPRGVQKFEEDYYRFLEMIRQKNGTQPWIICALGSMDYFLFDSIQRVAERFSTEKNDRKIVSFKYSRQRFPDGFGACGHPNLKTQTRMGNEIADFITQLGCGEAV